MVACPDGVRLHLSELGRGSGEAVLLVHGFSQNRQAFLRGYLPSHLLRRGFRVVVGELRGHGRSDRPAHWRLEDHLHLDLPTLAGAADAERLHYVGHSMGGLLGYAALGTALRFASLTGLGAPLRLGAGSPLVGAAGVVAAVAALPPWRRPLPVDRLLRALSGPLARRDAPAGLRALQRLLGLANPRASDEERVRAVLAASDPESMAVFRALLGLSRRRRPRLAGVDLLRAVQAAPIPVAAVVGSRDVFAPAGSVRELLGTGHRGPRRVVVLPRGAHVDLTVGAEVADAVVGLARFWEVA